jgi:UDPglucose--hexose-1-phosphate uridylyltransferase
MGHLNNHLRQNILTEQWVIYSPARAERPKYPERPKTVEAKNLPEKESLCPFCPGNEKMLPEITHEIKEGQNDEWFTRVVPNKYPALTTEGDIKGGNKGIYLTTSAFGRHEVIIESPFHNRDIPFMSSQQVERVLETYVLRYRFLLSNFKDILNVIIFRNHGSASGTSLIHPHSQMIGISIIPKYVHDREVIANDYFQKRGRCSLCDIIEFERNDGGRCVYENPSFLGFVPFASEVPFEVWIVPKRHCADFGEINELEKADLSEALKNILLICHERLNDPSYNYVIHSCSRPKKATPYLHWYMQIRPRTTTPAGFEIGSGVHINPSLPEDDAKVLRERTNTQDNSESSKTMSNVDARVS